MQDLLIGFMSLQIGHVIMWIIGAILIYLTIVKDYEPMLLLPIGFGAILANIPLSSAIGDEGIMTILLNAGIKNELFPSV